MRREPRELPSEFSPEDLFDVELNDDVRALLGEESPLIGSGLVTFLRRCSLT